MAKGSRHSKLRQYATSLGRVRHPLFAAALVAFVVAGVAWRYSNPPVAQATALPVVEAPVRPVEHHAPEDADRVIVTLRWGHTSASPTDAEPSQAGTPWDGYLALDCGDIERVDMLGIETDQNPTPPMVPDLARDPAARDPSDRVGPVVRGDDGDQRIYWRSRTHADWDGVRVTLAICRSDVADGVSTLRIVTPQKSYTARLDWIVDDFVSLRAAPDGSSLDVHMASTRERKRVPEARITLGAPTRGTSAPVAEVEAPSVTPTH